MSKVQRLLFVRHAQRLDRYVREAYPSLKESWTQECFLNNEYYPANMEFPVILPKRTPIDNYLDDTPLTTMGEGCAQLLGNRLAEIGIQIDQAYSSPSLRCVQTCSRIMQGMDDLNGPRKMKIRIEGGLYEFGSFCKSVPTFLEPKFLSDRGLPVDVNYRNQIGQDDLLHLSFESYSEFQQRAKKFLDKTINSAGPNVQTIMFVTHAPTLLTFVRELLRKPISEDNLEHFAQDNNVFNKPAYVATVLMEMNPDKKQWFLPSPQPVPCFEIRAHTSFSQNWLERTSYESSIV